MRGGVFFNVEPGFSAGFRGIEAEKSDELVTVSHGECLSA